MTRGGRALLIWGVQWEVQYTSIGFPEGNSRTNGDQAIVQENKREFCRALESCSP